VSAGAGSGKTWRIVRSLLDHVEAGVPVERLAAVTFTEAAAAELQQRLRAGLLAAGRVAEAGRVETAAICTIHSFALLLVQRYPLAAGLPPSPHVLDEVSSRAMLRRLLASWLRREADASLRAVLDAGLGPGMGLSARGFRDDETPEGRLQALVQQVIDKARALAMSPEAVESEGRRAAARALGLLPPSGDAAALEAAFGEAMVEAFAWQSAQPEDKRRKTDAPLHEALRQMRLEPEAEPFDHALRLHGVGRSKTAERELPALFPAASALAETHPAMRARVEAVVVAVFGVAAAVLRAYAAEKDRLGALDFEDMQLRALSLLQGRPGEAAPYAPLIAGALPVVVVDEFQDSAPLQFQLFEALRAAGASVTYVGDLKQGIYGFRGADADLFGALLARARRLGHPVETLDRSRRSRPELVGFANAVFGALLPRHGMPFDPLTADNDYTRGVCPPAGPCVEVAFYDKPNVHAPKLRAGVARVLSLLASGRSVLDRATRTPRPLRAGDIAVLAYAHNDLAQWAEALRAAGVATVREAPGWADTLEVRLVRAWLAMLSSPRDSAAAAAVLLSELYGLSQRAVAALTLARVSGSPRLALLRDAEDPAVYGLTPSERYALARCADDLKQCREWLRQLPLPEAVERCLARVDLAARLSLRLDARAAAQLRANVAAVVAHAHQLADRGDTALGAVGCDGRDAGESAAGARSFGHEPSVAAAGGGGRRRGAAGDAARGEGHGVPRGGARHARARGGRTIAAGGVAAAGRGQPEGGPRPRGPAWPRGPRAERGAALAGDSRGGPARGAADRVSRRRAARGGVAAALLRGRDAGAGVARAAVAAGGRRHDPASARRGGPMARRAPRGYPRGHDGPVDGHRGAGFCARDRVGARGRDGACRGGGDRGPRGRARGGDARGNGAARGGGPRGDAAARDGVAHGAVPGGRLPRGPTRGAVCAGGAACARAGAWRARDGAPAAQRRGRTARGAGLRGPAAHRAARARRGGAGLRSTRRCPPTPRRTGPSRRRCWRRRGRPSRWRRWRGSSWPRSRRCVRRRRCWGRRGSRCGRFRLCWGWGRGRCRA
jgi:superfamily I DNA/RNA helicase